MFIDQAGKVGM